ncbi:MAG: DUF58 domain-containing protein [Myxococcales bacterium]|nr:DUF58 domain-containing protein [Polyangiaceae bacterium]MDW8247674.1 DUF58 domain-containing protein [Myxococcales bacterium]
MKLYPTQTAFHLAIAGGAVVAVGLVTAQPAVVAWGAAVLVGVSIARAATLVSVARIRTAGFEMLWSSSRRSLIIGRGEIVELQAEVRNRDTLAARYVGLRVIASSQLDVQIEPAEGEVPASGKLVATVRVRAPRVGKHGIFGLALEVRGAPGLFEVPLTFANPFGLDVRPSSYPVSLRSARGGRTRLASDGGATGRSAGEGSDLREVREYIPGDPFKRIAWKASGRRGKLMVREMEREERALVWILLDASVELWAGPVGAAPLDGLIDDAAALVDRHLRYGNKVGAAVLGARVLGLIKPDRGPTHGARIHEMFSSATGVYDRDRCDLDEGDVVSRVIDHLRPLDPRGLADLDRRDLEKLVLRATSVMNRAPFRPEAPLAPSPQERRLRQYLAAFGVEVPPRLDPERPHTAKQLAHLLQKLAQQKPRPTVVYLLGAPPEHDAVPLLGALKHLRRYAEIRWILPDFLPALQGIPADRPEAALVLRAFQSRLRVARAREEIALRRLGIQLEHLRRPRSPPPLPPPDEGPER